MELKKRIDDILNKFDLKMNENNYHLYKQL